MQPAHEHAYGFAVSISSAIRMRVSTSTGCSNDVRSESSSCPEVATKAITVDGTAFDDLLRASDAEGITIEL